MFGREVSNRDVSNDYPLAMYGNRSTAQIYGVGEIPLNGKGLPLTGNAEGEEIVLSHMKI